MINLVGEIFLFNAGPIPNETFWELMKIGEIEFVLTPVRKEVGNGFLDTLLLEFSRDVISTPGRKDVAKALLDMTQYRPYAEDLFYHSLDNLESPENAFIRQESGRLYGTNSEDVARVINNIFHTLDALVHHPHSLCLNVTLDGLDYFDHSRVRKQGPLYVLGEQITVPEPKFYATNYPETHDTRNWLQSNLASTRFDNR